jgi:urocanate hydratase
MECLINQTLASKAAISVDQNTHVLCPVSIIGVELLSTRLANDNRINGFQMAGIGDQGQMDPVAASSWAIIGGTQVVLDITSSRLHENSDKVEHLMCIFAERCEAST